MASAIFTSAQLWRLVTTGGLDLDGSELRVRLVTSGFVPTLVDVGGRLYLADEIWDTGTNSASDASHHEVSAGAGYSTGGIQLVNPVVTSSVITYDDLLWPSLTKTFRAAVGVAVGTFGGLVDPLLFYLLLDSEPADIVSTGSDYTILWNDASGLFFRQEI